MSLLHLLLDGFAEIGAASQRARERQWEREEGNDGFGDSHLKLVNSDDGKECITVYKKPTRKYFVNVVETSEKHYRITVDHEPLEEATETDQVTYEQHLHIYLQTMKDNYKHEGEVELIIPFGIRLKREIY